MFSFFKGKGAAKSATTVHADVGAPLVRQAGFPTTPPTTTSVGTLKKVALDGAPPRALLLDQSMIGHTTDTAYITEASSGYPPLALVNVGGSKARIEVWEMGSGDRPLFTRKRTTRLDPEQDSWTVFELAGAAYLPGNRLLLAVDYAAPHVKQALFLYDVAGNSYTKIANVAPFNTFDQRKFFEAQLLAPDTVMVQYYTGFIRLAAEVYYNTPSHVRLFTASQPQGIEIVRLSAEDGGIERWTVFDRTLWIQSRDPRKADKPKIFTWSLNLENVLPR